jgi:antitoxin component YwqK of YwqJK toxin-antitoxin module
MSEQFDEKGKLMARGKYQSDRLRDSVWTIFAFDGTRLELATYSAGDLQGAYTMFYPDGRVMERGDYDKGQKTGVWTRFSDVGAKQRIATFAKGILQGTWTEFDSNGRISVVGSYQNDMREGKWNYLERGVLLRSEVYRRGILQDPSK